MPVYPHTGHRQRLRERFLQSGLDGFLDYEIVELLLTLGTPRRDCKAMAKAAIKQFKGLKGVLDASIEELQKIQGIGPSNAFGLKLFQAMAQRYAREQLHDQIVLTSPQAVADYLQQSIGRKTKEHFVSLYLDTRNHLLHTETISIGTVNASMVHPREVFQPAITHGATSLILAHNHPSGNLDPSTEDIRVTLQLIEAGKLLDLTILDHVIVSKNGWVSLKEEGRM